MTILVFVSSSIWCFSGIFDKCSDLCLVIPLLSNGRKTKCFVMAILWSFCVSKQGSVWHDWWHRQWLGPAPPSTYHSFIRDSGGDRRRQTKEWIHVRFANQWSENVPHIILVKCRHDHWHKKSIIPVCFKTCLKLSCSGSLLLALDVGGVQRWCPLHPQSCEHNVFLPCDLTSCPRAKRKQRGDEASGEMYS